MKKQKIYREVEALEELCKEISKNIWNTPEVGGDEKESANYARELLRKEGFIIVNEERLENAFYAEYGSGKPVIAVLGEYDALPGLSQKVCGKREPIEQGKAGHGCGHNLMAAGSITAAIAVKRFLENEEITGTIRFYGCPEEELLCGKVKMMYYNMFDGCDLALSWHPMSANVVYDEAYLASVSSKFNFQGRTSHAAFAPEQGRSALDAVELMNVGANYLREHVIDKARIHYTTDSCGYPPNIVPAHAKSWYFTRAPHMTDVKDIIRRIELNAKGAAMMTETEYEMKIESGCYEMNCNHSFANLTYKNLLEAEEIKYTEEEIEFAKELQETLDKALMSKEKEYYSAYDTIMFKGVAQRELCYKAMLTGSSDSGDVSQIMPMNLFTSACWPVGCTPHTWQATASTGSTLGEKGAIYAARVIAGTAYDLLMNPEIREEIQSEFLRNRDEDYKPLYHE